MSKREPKLLVGDILESARKIIEYTDGQNFEDFTQDSKTVDAVIRNFEIIGEAANRLPEDFKERFTDIDWHRIPRAPSASSPHPFHTSTFYSALSAISSSRIFEISSNTITFQTETSE